MVITCWALDAFCSGKDIPFEVSRYKVIYDTVVVWIQSLHSPEANSQQQIAYIDLVDDIFVWRKELLSYMSCTIVY